MIMQPKSILSSTPYSSKPQISHGSNLLAQLDKQTSFCTLTPSSDGLLTVVSPHPFRFYYLCEPQGQVGAAALPAQECYHCRFRLDALARVHSLNLYLLHASGLNVTLSVACDVLEYSFYARMPFEVRVSGPQLEQAYSVSSEFMDPYWFAQTMTERHERVEIAEVARG